MNWAVFTLLGITGGVLSGFVAFIFHLLKRSRQVLGNEETFDAPGLRGDPGNDLEGVVLLLLEVFVVKPDAQIKCVGRFQCHRNPIKPKPRL